MKKLIYLIICFVYLIILSPAFASEISTDCSIAAEELKKSHDRKTFNDIYDACYPLALKGDSEAQYYVGWYYGAIKHDEKEVEKWMKMSSEQGYAGAQLYIGLQHEDKQDIEKAVYWFKKAAEQDETLALLRLGDIYEKNIKDGAQAVHWYERAAKLNIANAMRELIKIYSNGIPGVPANKERAEYWKKRLKN